MSPDWAQRQRGFQARVVLGDEVGAPLALHPFTAWQVADAGSSNPPRLALFAVPFVLVAAVAAVVGLLVGLVAGSEAATTAGLATFVALGMGLAFASIFRDHGSVARLPDGPGCHLALHVDGTVVLVPVDCADIARLGDAGEVAVVGWPEPGGTLGFVDGDTIVWPSGPPVSGG